MVHESTGVTILRPILELFLQSHVNTHEGRLSFPERLRTQVKHKGTLACKQDCDNPVPVLPQYLRPVFCKVAQENQDQTGGGN